MVDERTHAGGDLSLAEPSHQRYSPTPIAMPVIAPELRLSPVSAELSGYTGSSGVAPLSVVQPSDEHPASPSLMAISAAQRKIVM